MILLLLVDTDRRLYDSAIITNYCSKEGTSTPVKYNLESSSTVSIGRRQVFDRVNALGEIVLHA